MNLAELLVKAGVTAELIVGDAEVSSIAMDSRKLNSGGLFVCMPGTNSDSQSFLPKAKVAGATAAIVYDESGLRLATELGLAVAQFSDEKATFADQIWRICDTFFDHPTRDMLVFGITGTNGKTTTAWLIRDMLQALGIKAAYLGTLGFQTPSIERELPNTTPFAVDLYSMLAEARDEGVQAIAIEVSSHALKEKRVDGLEFNVGVFTNLTQDHLDFHGTMEDYESSKWRLFDELPRQTSKKFVAAINIDDPVGQMWATKLSNPVTYGSQSHHAVLKGVPLFVGVDLIDLELGIAGQESAKGMAPLGGNYNVENLLSASAALYAASLSIEGGNANLSRMDVITSLFPKARPVPGRFEPVPNDSGIAILVDYAHTPDALEKLLDAVRPLTSGKVITVFGCGGDRDRTKRPKMAKAASERSDVTVVTSDNPRTEDPQSILDEVTTGIAEGCLSVSIIDRGEAIEYAISIASPGDVVVIAGKGHENYQIIGQTKYPMDDRELARKGIEKRNANN
ncbi:UDP-N-acetylmuramoyl-L-alanyl-D-glutamate--2,6-diaminopimelate ligase [soil metagenome]